MNGPVDFTGLRPPRVVMQDGFVDGMPRWLVFEECRGILAARTTAEVEPCLQRAEAAAAEGLWVAGFVTYEAAPAFDAALTVRPDATGPLLWMASFERVTTRVGQPSPPASPQTAWQPAVDRIAHGQSIGRIKDAIARGETYQVNLTFPCRTAEPPPADDLFARLVLAQRGAYSAFIETSDFAVCSASPELFFTLDGDRIACRPMKGTSPRGPRTQPDRTLAAALQASVKNRAENLMIVDMVRNDLGRIAAHGSVDVVDLFTLERYPGVWQLTSGVIGRTTAGIREIFRALFPSASITGAPKVQTMRLIAELEIAPRGVYTGAIGWIGPNRRAQFNVAIRTAWIDKRIGTATFGTGGGIVWDSQADAEYDEANAKSAILQADARSFDLLETLRWEHPGGFAFLDEHLERLADSAHYFGIPCDAKAVRTQLLAAAAAWPNAAMRVRLLVDMEGRARIEATRLGTDADFGDRPSSTTPGLKTALALSPVSTADRFLFHKTTRRDVYERLRSSAPAVDDVVLWNDAGDTTETTIGNLVADINGQLVTPPVESGLLPGVFRRHLLARGVLAEQRIPLAALQAATAVYRINSVRGWTRLLLA